LARARLLRAVSLIEQRRVTAIWAERDGRGKAVGAGEVARDRERQSLAGWKIDSARVVGGACDHEHDNKGGNSDEEDSGNLVHEALAS